jgi:hypothetical protein
MVTQTHRRQRAKGAQSVSTEIMWKTTAHCRATTLLFITGGNSDKGLPFSEPQYWFSFQEGKRAANK